MRKGMMHAMTRRTFGRGVGLLAAAGALSACTGTRGGGTSATASADLAAVRDYVELDSSPTFSGVDFDHVSPDPATVEGTVATATVDPAPASPCSCGRWRARPPPPPPAVRVTTRPVSAPR